MPCVEMISAILIEGTATGWPVVRASDYSRGANPISVTVQYFIDWWFDCLDRAPLRHDIDHTKIIQP